MKKIFSGIIKENSSEKVMKNLEICEHLIRLDILSNTLEKEK